MRVPLVLVVSFCGLVLSGCSVAPVLTSTSTTPGSAPGAALSGKVHGGQNPISGAHVYLYAVNDTGYGGPGIAASGGNASVSLLTSGTGRTEDGSGNYYVTTASDGSFSITGDYTCPSAYSHPYLYAAGGDAGSGSNSAITLLGPVSSCNSSQFVIVNEVSTVVLAYSFAGFASAPLNASASNTTLAATGLNNAAESIVNLMNVSTSTANATTPGSTTANTGTVPQTEINTLANILAACVNSTGSSSTQCSTLFSNAMNGSTPAPDTATAALNIAHNPGANIASLFALQAGSPPFVPDLPSAPNDFTITISYTGGGLDLPYSIAIDASGDAWVVSQAGYLSEFSPLGVAISGVTGFSNTCINSPYGVAIDGSGNVWVGNTGPDSLCEFSSAGVANSKAPFTGGGLNGVRGIAIDGSNNIWVANSTNNTLSEFNSSGTAISSSSGFTLGGLEFPYGIAIDASGNVWATDNKGTPAISEFHSSGSPYTASPFKGGGLNAPLGIAIDGSGNVWTANNLGLTLSEFDSGGTAVSTSSGFTGGGLDNPFGIAVDDAGNVWAANETNNSISEFNSIGTAISGTNGFTGTLTGLSALAEPYNLAIDGSGNIWVANFGGTGTVTEFVGAATPVVTPMAANLMSPYTGHAVNRP